MCGGAMAEHTIHEFRTNSRMRTRKFEHSWPIRGRQITQTTKSVRIRKITEEIVAVHAIPAFPGITIGKDFFTQSLLGGGAITPEGVTPAHFERRGRLGALVRGRFCADDRAWGPRRAWNGDK